MEAIMALGENGLLDEPAVPENHGEPPVPVNGNATNNVSDKDNAAATAATAVIEPGIQAPGSQEEIIAGPSPTAHGDTIASAAATS